DNRGVALIPLSETARDISLETPAAVRIRARQLSPKPYNVDRAEALPMLKRFLAGAPNAEMIWLSDGADTGEASAFVSGLAALKEGHAVTVISGGLPPARALAGTDNAAGGLTVNVLRSNPAGQDAGVVRALDLKGLSLGEATFSFGSSDLVAKAQFDLP